MHPNVKIIGIGGGGIHTIDYMIDCGMQGEDFIAIDRDSQELKRSKAHTQILIGENLHTELGTLSAMSCRKIAEEAKDTFKKHLCGANMVFVVTCMGGSTGSGAASVVASCAREVGALTVAVVTKPFMFEGPRRRKIAEEAMRELKEKVDTIIAISNDSLMPIIDKKTTLSDVFHIVDDTIRHCVQSITDSLNMLGIVNVEFANLKSFLSNAGSAKMGYGTVTGEYDVQTAVKEILNSPLLENTVEGETGVFLSVIGGEGTSLQDIEKITSGFSEVLPQNTKIVYGATVNNKFPVGEFQVTVIVLNPNGLDFDHKAMKSSNETFNPEEQEILLPMGWLRPEALRPEAEDEEETPEDLMPRTDGKQICDYLRNIRVELAKANNIPFECEPCSFTGSCAGTCEKCDQEAAYLRDELNKIPEKNRKYPQHILSDWEKALCSAK